MADFPDVTVLICTYNRYDEITRTMTALRDNLVYPADHLKWIVADDSTPGAYVSRLRKHKAFKDIDVTFAVTETNGGWGRNVNNGHRHVTTEYLFFCEDDYVLSSPLDLRVGVAVLDAKPDIGMMRYRGTAGDHLVFHQFEARLERLLPDHLDGLGLPGRQSYLQIDSGSPSLYLYSHGPHLKHRRFHDFYGAYPEGLKLGETEEGYAHIVKAKMKEPGAPAIVILPEWVAMRWDHVGKSYQLTEADKSHV